MLCSKWKRGISLEYLPKEKYVPFSTTDKYFAQPPSSEEDLFTACGQTVVLSNPDLAANLSSLPEMEQEIISLYFFEYLTHKENGKHYAATLLSRFRRLACPI